jgi:hypothetical protein
MSPSGLEKSKEAIASAWADDVEREWTLSDCGLLWPSLC